MHVQLLKTLASCPDKFESQCFISIEACFYPVLLCPHPVYGGVGHGGMWQSVEFGKNIYIACYETINQYKCILLRIYVLF